MAVYGVLFLGALAFVMSLTSCRWEVGKIDPFASPSPSPVPSASPSPSPDGSPSPSPSPSPGASPSPSPTSLQIASSSEVAAGNAELLEAATAQAAEEAGNFSEAMQRVAAEPAAAGEEYAGAMESLRAVQQSYRQAEAAVFYVDPSSADELNAQPDPLGAGSLEVMPGSLAEISAMLKDLSAAAKGDLDEAAIEKILPLLRSLASRSTRLSGEMEQLASAWRDSDSSFRERYFLASPENAVARIFQGLLALSGDVLPNRWMAAAGGETAGVPAADEISGRIDALRNIYLGGRDDGSVGDTPGLDDLVSAVSPLRAAAAEASIAQAAALSKALKFSPQNAETRRQLLVALDEVTRQLTLSAGVLGIRVEATDQNPGE